MQTTIHVQVQEEGGGSKVYSFELDSQNLTFLPDVGDAIELPGMDGAQVVSLRSFKYSEPATLEVWYDVEGP